MTGGRASRDKGNRLERALVRVLQSAGFASERVPLSGSAGGRYTSDLTTPLLGRDLRVEAKARGHGFQQLYAWLDGADLLVVKADRLQPLVVVPLKLAIEIAQVAEKNSRTSESGAPGALPGNSVKQKDNTNE
jgi:Holliday junction resolvase